MTPTTGPALSVVIVTYASLTDLQRCLPSLYGQVDGPAVEVIVVDNHGSDGVAEWLPGAYPDALYVRNPTNSGYAGGNNLGLQHLKGQWILFLNPDTVLAPGCLFRLMETAHANPNAFLNPKLLNPDGTINACGNQMHYTGITSCRALNQPSQTHTGLETVSLLSGAALLAPTEAVRKLGGFDERYFMYFEDADLSLRARLSGHPLLCDARAVVTHYYRLGMNPTKFYYLERNRLITLNKALTKNTLRQLLPALLLTELLTWAFAFRGLDYLKSRVKTYRWLWRERGSVREQSQAIGATRQLTDAQLMAGATLSLPMDQLAPGPVGRLANAILTPIYRWLKPRQLTTTD